MGKPLMAQAHRDPVFDEVAKREARDCTGCVNYQRIFGLASCMRNRWHGEKNMRRCDYYRRKGPD